jgi:hypothetical protein
MNLLAKVLLQDVSEGVLIFLNGERNYNCVESVIGFSTLILERSEDLFGSDRNPWKIPKDGIPFTKLTILLVKSIKLNSSISDPHEKHKMKMCNLLQLLNSKGEFVVMDNLNCWKNYILEELMEWSTIFSLVYYGLPENR